MNADALVPPHDHDTEAKFLGSLLQDGAVAEATAPTLRPGDFHKPAHGTIHDAILAVLGRGEPCDVILVRDELGRRGRLDDVGGVDYLATLGAAAPTGANAAHYARIISDKAHARAVIGAASGLLRAAYDGESGADLRDRTEAALLALSGDHATADVVAARDIVPDILREWETPSPKAAPIPTGLADLDLIIGGGVRAPQLVVVAGRTSMGKSAFANNLMRHAAVDCGVPVLAFTLEVGRAEMLRNTIAAVSGVDAGHLHDATLLRTDEKRAAFDAAHAVGNAPIYVCDRAPLTIPTLRSETRRAKAKHGIGLVVVDYVQLMDGAGLTSRNANREREVAAISGALKMLAKELSVPVVAVAQLNREAESREDHRPRLSDLRESGAIENDADVVLLLYREFYYSKAAKDRGTAEVIVAKNRNGPTERVAVSFREQVLRFGNRDVGSLDPGASWSSTHGSPRRLRPDERGRE